MEETLRERVFEAPSVAQPMTPAAGSRNGTVWCAEPVVAAARSSIDAQKLNVAVNALAEAKPADPMKFLIEQLSK